MSSSGSAAQVMRFTTMRSNLFGAALNGFLPLYVIVLGVGIMALASTLYTLTRLPSRDQCRPRCQRDSSAGT